MERDLHGRGCVPTERRMVALTRWQCTVDSDNDPCRSTGTHNTVTLNAVVPCELLVVGVPAPVILDINVGGFEAGAA